MRNRWTYKLYLWAVSFIGLGASSATAQTPPTLDQILEAMQRAEGRFFGNGSMLVKYERVRVTNMLPSSGEMPVEMTVAYRGSKWFVQKRFTHPSKTAKLWVPAKPKTQVMRDGFLLDWNESGDLAGVHYFGVGGNIYYGLLYTRNLFLDAPKYISKCGGADLNAVRNNYPDWAALPYFPEFFLQNKAQYRILSKPELVSGVNCWIVEWPGMDRFWVDPSRDLAVVRRAYCWGPSKPLRFDVTHADYREVKPGFWLPCSTIEDQYADIRVGYVKESDWGKVGSRIEYKVTSLTLDNLDDSFFDIRLPPNTKVFDRVRQIDYRTSEDNADPFGDAFVEALAQMRRRHYLRLAIATLLVMAILGLGGYGWYRARRSRLGAGTASP